MHKALYTNIGKSSFHHSLPFHNMYLPVRFMVSFTIYNQLLGNVANQSGTYRPNVLPAMTVDCTITAFIFTKHIIAIPVKTNTNENKIILDY